jgi:hypothetical protein
MLQPKSMLVSLIALGLGAAAAASPAPRIEVVFDDPAGAYASYYADIARVTVAAGDAWASNFVTVSSGADLTVNIVFAAIPTASARSLSSALVGSGLGGIGVWEQGAAYKVRTGIDANGAAPDIEVNIGIAGYLQNELWFDPAPALRSEPVPPSRTDAYSVMLHEFGHAFGFNGWLDPATGVSPGNYESTFDQWVQPQQTVAGTGLFFTGPSAVALYGGPVPLTFGNFAHLGNAGSGTGTDLLLDLMNGVVFYRGTQYDISALDLAILQDTGMPLQAAGLMAALAPIPEPATAAMWLCGLFVLAATARRRAGAVSRPARDTR